MHLILRNAILPLYWRRATSKDIRHQYVVIYVICILASGINTFAQLLMKGFGAWLSLWWQHLYHPDKVESSLPVAGFQWRNGCWQLWPPQRFRRDWRPCCCHHKRCSLPGCSRTARAPGIRRPSVPASSGYSAVWSHGGPASVMGRRPGSRIYISMHPCMQGFTHGRV